MKRFVLAIVLACALSGTALAGEVPSTGAPAPASQASSPLVVTIILTIISFVGK